MSDTLKPETPEQLRDAVAWAVAEEQPLAVVGRGSKHGLGRPMQTAHDLDLSGLSGILSYEPEELVLTARAGTPLAEIQAALAERRQCLAFEPPDWAPLWDGAAGEGSLGGLLACNLAGPRRIKAGAARDHFLGFSAVTGRGELFKAGGKVVKNVTGYDLPKLIAGSYGTLAVMSEVTVKVLPAPEKTRTVLILGLDDARAAAALSEALGSPHEVSAAAHLPARVAALSEVGYVRNAGGPVTAVRLEGPPSSVAWRCEHLRGQLGSFGPTEELHSMNSARLWREVADMAVFADRPAAAVWRVSVAPTAGPAVAAAACRADDLYYFDWGGGLLLIAMADLTADRAERLRAAVAASGGGHATLLRASPEQRGSLPPFEPPGAAKERLTRRIKDAFDPRGVLNPGRLYAFC